MTGDTIVFGDILRSYLITMYLVGSVLIFIAIYSMAVNLKGHKSLKEFYLEKDNNFTNFAHYSWLIVFAYSFVMSTILFKIGKIIRNSFYQKKI